MRAGAALDKVQRIATADLVVAGTPPKDDGVPHFPTEKERLEGALAALDAHLHRPGFPSTRRRCSCAAACS